MVGVMAFTGTPTITQVSDNLVRITGLSLASGESGAIGLHGGTSLDDLLGAAASFGVLAQTYTNDEVGTSINGDLGYIVAPAVAATVSGSTHANDATYQTAVDDAAQALQVVLALPATFTFAPGNVNLSTDATHGTAGTFAPGVYDVDGDIDTTTAAITLAGDGLFVFRCTGTLTIANGSTVQCTSGARPHNVWWVPVGATLVGDESVFVGNVYPSTVPTDIEVSDDVTWEGRAISVQPSSQGGVVSTVTDTITVPPFPGPAVRLPAAFICVPYTYGGQAVEVDASIEVSVQPAATGVATAIPVAVVKTGTTNADFLATLTNTHASLDTPDLEITVRFHE